MPRAFLPQTRSRWLIEATPFLKKVSVNPRRPPLIPKALHFSPNTLICLLSTTTSSCDRKQGRTVQSMSCSGAAFMYGLVCNDQKPVAGPFHHLLPPHPPKLQPHTILTCPGQRRGGCCHRCHPQIPVSADELCQALVLDLPSCDFLLSHAITLAGLWVSDFIILTPETSRAVLSQRDYPTP